MNVDGSPRCFENVHPDTWDVYDASAWAVYHPGNRPRLNNGLTNPITDFADKGEVAMRIPAWHIMDKTWNNQRSSTSEG